MNAIPRNPNKLLAHPIPNLWYIAVANNGKPAPKEDLIKSFPARTLATLSGYASLRYGNTALNSVKAAIPKKLEPMIGMIQ